MVDERKKLFLDLDDTILDTSSYLIKQLSTMGILTENISGTDIYELRDTKSFSALVIESLMSDYSKIPFRVGAKDGIKILSTEYDISICSIAYSSGEALAKRNFSKKIGIPAEILIGSNKDSIDMSGAVFVDDSTVQLNLSNADRKICMYKKGNFQEFKGLVVFDWCQLVFELMK